MSAQAAVAVAVGIVSAAVIFAAAAVVLLTGPGPVDRMALDMSGASPQARHAYEIAPLHRVLFEHLPCYCGCAVLPKPHRSLYDCFVNPDGSPDPHAIGCDTCVKIALDAEQAAQSGASDAAIRSMIDAKYSSVGRGTNTPLPQ